MGHSTVCRSPLRPCSLSFAPFVLVLLVLLSGKQPHPLHPSQNDAYLVVASSANLPLMKFLFSVSPTNALNCIDATHCTPMLGRSPQKQLTFFMPVNLEPSSSQFSVPECDLPPSSARVGWSHSNPESRFLKQQLKDGPGLSPLSCPSSIYSTSNQSNHNPMLSSSPASLFPAIIPLPSIFPTPSHQIIQRKLRGLNCSKKSLPLCPNILTNFIQPSTR